MLFDERSYCDVKDDLTDDEKPQMYALLVCKSPLAKRPTLGLLSSILTDHDTVIVNVLQTTDADEQHTLGSRIKGFKAGVWDQVSWLIMGEFLIARAKMDKTMRRMIKEHLHEEFKDVRQITGNNASRKWLCDDSVRLAVYALEVGADLVEESSLVDRTTQAWECEQD